MKLFIGQRGKWERLNCAAVGNLRGSGCSPERLR